MKYLQSKLVHISVLCCLVLVMVIYGFIRRNYVNTDGEKFRFYIPQVSEVSEWEQSYPTAGGWITPPPLPVGRRQWGVYCSRNEDCAYPWHCNGRYCDVGSRVGSR